MGKLDSKIDAVFADMDVPPHHHQTLTRAGLTA
jgi:hypothetical protein